MHDKILQHGEAMLEARRDGGIAGTLTADDHTLSMIRNCSAALLPPISERLVSRERRMMVPWSWSSPYARGIGAGLVYKSRLSLVAWSGMA